MILIRDDRLGGNILSKRLFAKNQVQENSNVVGKLIPKAAKMEHFCTKKDELVNKIVNFSIFNQSKLSELG